MTSEDAAERLMEITDVPAPGDAWLTVLVEIRERLGVPSLIDGLRSVMESITEESREDVLARARPCRSADEFFEQMGPVLVTLDSPKSFVWPDIKSVAPRVVTFGFVLGECAKHARRMKALSAPPGLYPAPWIVADFAKAGIPPNALPLVIAGMMARPVRRKLSLREKIDQEWPW